MLNFHKFSLHLSGTEKNNVGAFRYDTLGTRNLISNMDKNINDKELIEQIRKGDEKAFKQLFLTYYAPLCEYASQYVSDVDSEELVQDLMLFLWETRENLFIETSLQSYLFVSTKHRCLNAIKRNQFHERIHDQNIRKAIQELPDTYRETFILSRFGEKTNQQVAEKLGVSVKTVEYRISQSLKILRHKLKDYLPLLITMLN